jgi:fructose-1,6-bisphosphatase/inositol monophosphatase family enzyme
VTSEELLEVLRAAAGAVRGALDALDDWGPAGAGATHAGQYHSDVAADAVAVAVLDNAGLGVLSEESGLHHGERDVLVALDPVDGSTNASRRLPWYATSLCAVDADGPLAAVVVNQATGEAFEAARGKGAFSAGQRLAASGCTTVDAAVVGLAGWPPRHGGWRQMRALGAAALDLCAVGAGRLDAYVDFSLGAHGPWDYLGGMLVCHEAGATIADAWGRDLLCRDHGDRRTPVAAATPELLEALVALRTEKEAS